MDIGILAAFSAGLLSFISPCILPIVPFYLTYLAGQSVHRMAEADEVADGLRLRMIMMAVMFSLGMISVFVLLGLVSTSLGQLLRDYFDLLRWIAAGIVFVMGLQFLGLIQISVLLRQAGWQGGDPNTRSFSGAFVLGLSFAFGWTPCVGPILAAILFFAAGQETVLAGAGLLVAYGLGMTLPFVLAAAFIGPFLKWATRFRSKLKTIERVMGLCLILFAALIASDSIALIAYWVLENVPAFSKLG